jgi:hypothetical protein
MRHSPVAFRYVAKIQTLLAWQLSKQADRLAAGTTV